MDEKTLTPNAGFKSLAVTFVEVAALLREILPGSEPATRVAAE
jgi:hypothetical protein